MSKYYLTYSAEELDEALTKFLSGYKDVSQVTATADRVAPGYKFVDADGNVAEGTLHGMSIDGVNSDGYITGVTVYGDLCSNEFYQQKYLTTVAGIENSTNIPDYCFYNCSALLLESLPESLCTIGEAAFYFSNVSISELPSNLNYIGASAFRSCKKLTITSIPDGIVELYSYTFNGCTGLTTLNFTGRTHRHKPICIYQLFKPKSYRVTRVTYPYWCECFFWMFIADYDNITTLFNNY